MRIAYVTAHLPPDFTSGATLLVERLAAEAAHRGHEVQVFSGAIHQGLADGEVRVDRSNGARPFTIRWIGTADRVDQDVDGNWDNPRATTAAEAWLREFRPDVIHLHAVQTLGVGVVDAATSIAGESGARTVVTMHDLWWWCARLFLVDTQLRPCPLVTDVGTCACARSASWRRARAERLRAALGGVDQILAPSSALRDVIIANGVDADRVAVDENHVADAVAVAPAVRHAATDAHLPVRFLYLGGGSALKGADVMCDAARQLDDAAVTGWRLTAFGLDPVAVALAPDHVQALPPFDPADVVDVMSEHDVLVLPSLARESFSIAAREALGAGLAVITSDCLGPEEVVRNGVNGLVVPTGDASALAHAMRSLITDRATLTRLRVGAAAEPITLRTAAEQVTALLEIYAATPPTRTAPHDRTVGFVVGLDGDAARYRVHHAREALTLDGDEPGPVAHHLDPAVGELMDRCDVVVLQQVPATPAMIASIESWRADGALVLFDLADDVELDSLPITMCDGTVAATPALAERAARVAGVPAVVVTDAVGLVEMQLVELTRPSPPPRPTEPVQPLRVGYVSTSTARRADLDLIEPVLVELLQRHQHVELSVIGPCQPGPELAAFGARVRHLALPAWRELPDLLCELDINLAPADPKRSEGPDVVRSWLTASLVEVPTIASASSSADVIDHGRTGLVCSSLSDWTAELDVLVGDATVRARLGAAARRELDLHHSPRLTARRYREAFDALGRGREIRKQPGSPRVVAAVADHSRSVVRLDPYDLGDAIIGDAVVRSMPPTDDVRRGLVGRLGATVRRNGGALVRRVLPG